MADGPFFVHESAVVDEGAVIGEGTKVWHFCHVMSGARIGRECTLGQNVFVASQVAIGNHCKIQNNVSVYEGVILEDYVFCGPSMVFTNVRNPRCLHPQDQSEHYVRTLVGRGASIGANATIVCGVTLHPHSFVAAGAVVTKDVPAYAVVAGVPARVAGFMSEAGEPLVFGAEGVATDSTGACYRLVGDEQVTREA